MEPLKKKEGGRAGADGSGRILKILCFPPAEIVPEPSGRGALD